MKECRLWQPILPRKGNCSNCIKDESEPFGSKIISGKEIDDARTEAQWEVLDRGRAERVVGSANDFIRIRAEKLRGMPGISDQMVDDLISYHSFHVMDGPMGARIVQGMDIT